MAMGHSVKIFAASTVHNSDQSLIENGEAYGEEVVDGGNIAQAIMEYAAMPRERDQAFEENACRAAENYDFENLTRKLLAVIEA